MDSSVSQSENQIQSLADAARIFVTYYPHKKSNKPQLAREGAWGLFVSSLVEDGHERRKNKDGQLFAFHRLRDNGTRCNDDVVSLHGWALDLDKASEGQIVETLNALNSAGLAYVCYSTFSDSPKQQKLRVVGPLVAPVLVRQWPHVWRAIVAKFAPWSDEQCKDVARMYYLPACKPDAEPMLMVQQGAPLDVSTLPAEKSASNDDARKVDLNAMNVVKGTDGVYQRCPRGLNPFTHAEDLCRTMPPAISGQGGHLALLRVARALRWGLELDRNQCRLMISELYNPRCEPEWSDQDIEHKLDTAEQEHSAPIARGALLPPPVAPCPEIVGDARGTQFWIHRDQGEYFSPVAKGMLPARASEARLDCAGNKAETIAARAVIAEKVTRDFGAKGVRWDETERAIVQGYALPRIEPVFDAAADKWFRVLAGNRYTNLAEWFTSCQQCYIDKLAACLVLIGDTGIGKTLIGLLAARMWGESTPVPLGHAVDKFNSTITKCPIVFDDESARLKKGDVSTADFREMISARERTFEPKGVDKRHLKGAQRFGVTANGASDLRFSDLGGPQVIEALGARLLVIQCGNARKALEPLRVPNCDDVDFQRLDRHVAWIASTTQLQTQRFLASEGASDPEALRVITQGVVTRYAELFDVIREALTAGEVSGSAGLAFVQNGVLWVRGAAGGVRMTPGEVFGALAPWELAAKRESVKVDGASIRARAYDVDKLAQVLS